MVAKTVLLRFWLATSDMSGVLQRLRQATGTPAQGTTTRTEDMVAKKAKTDKRRPKTQDDDDDIAALELRIHRLTLAGLRTQAARTERTYVLQDDGGGYLSALAEVALTWKSQHQPGKAHPMGSVHILLGLVLVEKLVENWSTVQEEVRTALPELRMMAEEQQLRGLLNTLLDHPSRMQLVIPSCTFFTTVAKKGILKVAPAHRRLLPPEFPIIMDSIHLFDMILWPLRALEEMGTAPKSRFEKAVEKKLRRL